MKNNMINIKEDKLEIVNLMSDVDLSQEFTLMDVFQFIKRGEEDMPLDVLGAIIQCYCVPEMMKEIESKPFTPDADAAIDHLELSWGIHKDQWGCVSSWSFDGKGRVGEIPDDLMEQFKYNNEEPPKDWIQGYAIEFTPLWKLSGYAVKINSKISLEDWTGEEDDEKYKNTILEYTPTIKVIDLLYSIFWELSFAGSPEERDDKREELEERCKEAKESIANGTAKFIPFEELKEKLKEKIKSLESDPNAKK